MSDKLIHGLYAGVLTPRMPDDSVDKSAFARVLEFLCQRKIEAYAINGATGEFCLTSPGDLKTALGIAQTVVPGARLLCGIGAAGVTKSLELARIAAGEGAQALLLPMPYFFPYQQQDLEAFVRTVAGSVSLPVLLYNLPKFTTELATETSCRLIRETPNVIGIKDSGGSLETLRLLTKSNACSCRMVGNDGVLADALRERVCDGVVSGVACVLPELIHGLFAEREHVGREKFERLSALLDAFRRKLARFPTPWALKWIAEARGICPARFSQPITDLREQQARGLTNWYLNWEKTLSTVVDLI